MPRSRKIFLIFVVIFVVLLGYASYDIGRRTTFPGSRPQLKERLEKQYSQPDTARVDSARSSGKKNS
jgi:hypothetical protein